MIHRTIRYVLFIAAVLYVMNLHGADLSPERVIYRGNPLPISLSVGHERRITFDHPIYVDVPESLTQLTTQIVGPDLYWKSSEAFDPIRIVIGEEGGNKIYLINLSAVQQDNPAPQLLVTLDQPHVTVENIQSEVSVTQKPAQKKIGYGGLFRYAAKQLYAPSRLREAGSVNNLSSAPIPEERIHHLIRHHKVITRAMGAWQNDSHYITALLVTNATDAPITLDPREIRGEVLAARFQRNHLSPYGDEGDSTSLYLITNRPIAETINGHAIRIDPTTRNAEQSSGRSTN